MGRVAQHARRDRTLAEAFRRSEPAQYPRRASDLAFIRRLARRGITTVPELIASFEDLPARSQRVALWLFDLIGDRRAVPLLIRLFDEARFCPVACMALDATGGRRALRYLMGVVEGELAHPPRARDLGRLGCALYGLETMDGSVEATGLFLRAARDGDLPVHLRATAVTALGMAAEEAPGPLPHQRQVAALVRRLLDHPSPTLRAGAILSAGLLRLRRARARLEEIARTDRASDRGWGSLARLAREALEELGS